MDDTWSIQELLCDVYVPHVDIAVMINFRCIVHI